MRYALVETGARCFLCSHIWHALHATCALAEASESALKVVQLTASSSEQDDGLLSHFTTPCRCQMKYPNDGRTLQCHGSRPGQIHPRSPLGGRSQLGAPCGQLLLHKRQQRSIERLGHLVVGTAQCAAIQQHASAMAAMTACISNGSDDMPDIPQPLATKAAKAPSAPKGNRPACALVPCTFDLCVLAKVPA